MYFKENQNAERWNMALAVGGGASNVLQEGYK